MKQTLNIPRNQMIEKIIEEEKKFLDDFLISYKKRLNTLNNFKQTLDNMNDKELIKLYEYTFS
jgi:hypothetical protein